MAIQVTVCKLLHDRLRTLPRMFGEHDVATIPQNGIYVVFEAGESAHGGERVVRVGTHTGANNLQARLKEHMFTPNKDRSVFRKHIGRCLLAQRGDPFYAQWDLDLTTREKRETYGHLIDRSRLKEVENEVTAYMNRALTFSVFAVGTERVALETKLLSTLSQCPQCGPSEMWLGRHHPNRAIAEGGLWNINGLRGLALSDAEAHTIF